MSKSSLDAVRDLLLDDRSNGSSKLGGSALRWKNKDLGEAGMNRLTNEQGKSATEDEQAEQRDSERTLDAAMESSRLDVE